MVDYFIKCLLLSSIVQITKSELLPVQIRLTFINGYYIVKFKINVKVTVNNFITLAIIRRTRISLKILIIF